MTADRLYRRGNIVIFVIGFVLALYIWRMFFIQVMSQEYGAKADQNVIKRKVIVPPRGNIYNRYGDIYVSNNPIFEIFVTPRELHIPDTSVLEEHLQMSRGDIEKRIARARAHSPYKESSFAQFVEPEVLGPLLENTWDFRGISFNATTKRHYEYPVGANFLGYISEVDSAEIRSSTDVKYRMGDLIGKTGIERHYDRVIRGTPGERIVLKDVFNREVGRYNKGKFDTPSKQGSDLMLGIDTDLQAFGEDLMKNKKGSIVAIEPSSGEILAFISAPSYDPNILSGMEARKNWRKLTRDTLNPLFNRPLQAAYPPGSIFKIPVALAALNEEIIKPNTIYSCGGGFWRNGGKPGCRLHASPLGLKNALKVSCNSYFAGTYVDFLHSNKYESVSEAYDTWAEYMLNMGIGVKLSVDLPYEKDGLVPTSAFYDNEKRWYGKNRWNAMTIISNSIGQGEIMMTPLQMANMTATVANRGYYFPPHFVKAYRSEEDQHWEAATYEMKETGIKAEHFQTVADAMEMVVNRGGTAGRARISDIIVCGKTGTVQNPHGENHAVFVGFAPKENPQIAIAVVVENAGGGGTWAAPTASLMIEKYIRKEIVEKKYEYQRILKANFKQ